MTENAPPLSDAEFLAQLTACSLPEAQWTHRAHVKLAFLALRERPFPQAMEYVRRVIQAYNAAHNVPETPTRGYNETTTQAFVRLVAATMQAYGSVMPTPDADTFCDTHPQLLQKHVLRLFYSPGQRMRPDAKFQFVEPDLAPLPCVEEAPGL